MRRRNECGAVLSTATLSLGVEYRSRAKLPPSTDEWWLGVLGVAQFGLNAAPLDLAQVPVAAVPLSPLGAEGALHEIWRTDGTLRAGRLESVQFRCNDQLLFGCITVPEPQEANANGVIEAATAKAYAQIFATLEATGYRQLARVWNYVSAINQPAEVGERYWLFNNARHEAFVAFGRLIPEAVPAASAVGTPRGSPLVIYFLATRASPQMLENPRQVSAYRYPTQYGPCSPTFSRAALLAEGGDTLLTSGTASIVGHATVHPGNAAAQTRESLTNISMLVDVANARVATRFALESLTYKVYVRNAADLPAVAEVMGAEIGHGAPVVYLGSDICRRDLLVEMEAVGSGQRCRP